MGNAALLYENLADDATIAVSSQLAAAAGALVQNVHVARKWRSESSGDWLLADLGAFMSLDTIAVMGLTATEYRVRLSSSDPGGAAGDILDTGTLAVDQAYAQAIALLDAPAAARYLRIDLANSGGSYVEAGRLVAGLRNRFEINFSFDWSIGYVDPSIVTKTRGGQTQVSREQSYRQASLKFDFLRPTDRFGFVQEADRLNGIKDDVLFIFDEDSTALPRDTIWGRVVDLSPVSQPFFDVYSKDYRIEERL